MKKVSRPITICLLLLLACSVSFAEELELVGSIKSVTGQASVIRDDQRLVARPGLRISARDTLVTGKDSNMGIVLRDDTVLGMGPLTTLELKEFQFEPAKGALSSVMKVVKGVAAFLTGQIARLAPENARVETPDGYIGFRGTRFAVKVY